VWGDDRAEARFHDTAEPGIYRLNPPSGPILIAATADPRETDPSPLEPAEAVKLADGWPLQITDDANAAIVWGGGTGGARRELWRWLVLAAIAGLCLEVAFTRRLARQRGLVAEGVS